ncbi:PepSY domain-containing protein [Streptomyces sp. S.PB5]|uniref:PepSY domain-containing protein n=1 Tax=Streptomyces sp. S.PB5 TaxID=3020844 RepID=UPI0025AF61C4|nr:PepSY domain-containing protein [Streptomyces sp. S.PB5]MDN3024903.1 PepSY domain-containing protein [Streptomyces sp. S.PB5]
MKRNIVIATLTAAALVTGGTVAAFAAGDDDTTPQGRTSAAAQAVVDRDDTDDVNDRNDDADDVNGIDDDRTTVTTGDITAAQAIEAALKHTPGTAVSADLDDGTWDVDVMKSDGTEYSVKVAPDTGKVLGAHRDDDSDDDSEDRAEPAALKSAEFDAHEIALAAASKGTVTEIGADDDNGTVVWSVDTVKDKKTSEWKAALNTGKLTADHDD